MPDESNVLNQTQSATVPDEAAPVMTDPQKLVDEALTPSEPVATTLLEEVATQTQVPPSETAFTPMSDELPLAFAHTVPADQPATTPNPPGIDTTPPVFTPPLPTATAAATPPEPPKKKKGKVLGVVLGVFILVVGVVGGLAGYNYYTTGQLALIAPINPEDGEVGIDRGREPNPDRTSTGTRGNSLEREEIDWLRESNNTSGTGGSLAIQETLREVEDVIYSEGEGTGSENILEGDECPVGYTGLCMGGSGTCNNRYRNTDPTDPNGGGEWIGICVPKTEACLAGDSCPELCTAEKLASGTWYPTQESGGGSFCDESGRQCRRYRIERMNGPTPSESNSWCFVGYGEQCGEPESCGPGTNETLVASPSPTPTTPTLACMGLTKNKTDAEIKIGTVVQFTCAGTSTPAGAVDLTYQFQLQKDAGAWQALTATGNKASYTVAATGEYKVRCKACGTIGSASICDPVWTGASQ